jgi:hypothetical protein
VAQPGTFALKRGVALGLSFISLCDGERLGAVVFAVVRAQGELLEVRRQARRRAAELKKPRTLPTVLRNC